MPWSRLSGTWLTTMQIQAHDASSTGEIEVELDLAKENTSVQFAIQILPPFWERIRC